MWNWSFGRQDTWRLGFYGSDVKFEVFPPSGCAHSTQMVYPLYAGRWYHLAPSMKTWSTRTNLSHFVNGQLLAWKNETSYTVKTGSAFLYLGWDQATAGATFKGIVDEFRLYKRALSQNSTRGLLWFTGGSNTLVTPRGVFYESKMYQGLNGSYDSKSPLAGAVVNGNDNTLASNLNSRVIQLVITKNVTLADAWRILDLARTNKSGNVTSFPFFATAEFHTLGFAWEVSKLVANTSVDNGGNFSAPPPPLNLWALFWNTIAGWAERAWNAVTAVWAFFVAAGKWLATAFMSYVKGLTTGDWQDFKNQVLEPVRKALEAFIEAMKALMQAIVTALFTPVASALASVISSLIGYIGFIIDRHFDPSPLQIAAVALESILGFAGVVMLLLAAIAGTLMTWENVPPFLAVKPMLILMRNIVVYALTPIILLAIIGMSLAVPSGGPKAPGPDGGLMLVRESVPNDVQFLMELPYAVSDLLLELFTVGAGPAGELPFAGTAEALATAGIALAIDSASVYIEDPRVALGWDLFALMFALVAWGEIAFDPAGEEIPLTSTIASSLAIVAMALAINAIMQDIAAIGRGG